MYMKKSTAGGEGTEGGAFTVFMDAFMGGSSDEGAHASQHYRNSSTRDAATNKTGCTAQHLGPRFQTTGHVSTGAPASLLPPAAKR